MFSLGPAELMIIVCILGFFVFIAVIILAALLMRPRATAAGSMPPDEDSLKLGEAAGGDLQGTYPSPQVARLRGQPVSSTPPSDGQVLTWNQALGQWEPRDLPGDNTALD